MQLFSFGQCVADSQGSVIRYSNDVAGPGLFHHVTVAGKKEHRVVEKYRFAAPHVEKLHSAVEPA